MIIFKTVGLFLLAGISEIGGAYLIWQWLRLGKPPFWGLLGLTALGSYGIIQTFQSFAFGRAFAAYGGIFIFLALAWGWLIDGQSPDRWDLLGMGVCLVGVTIILWGPRA